MKELISLKVLDISENVSVSEVMIHSVLEGVSGLRHLSTIIARNMRMSAS